jgi:hypothetical protein
MLKQYSKLVVFTGLAYFCAAITASSADGFQPVKNDPGVISWRNEQAVLADLRPALDSNKSVGRIYYRARSCSADMPDAVPFPRIEVHPANADSIGLDAVRSVFRDAHEIRVMADHSGTIRIWIGGVPDEILHTKISHLTLNSRQQYNPVDAIEALLINGDVESAGHRLGLRPQGSIDDHLLAPPLKELPHLPSTLTNVTLDQAFDLIATIFKGAIIYGICPEAGKYDVGFASVSESPNPEMDDEEK